MPSSTETKESIEKEVSQKEKMTIEVELHEGTLAPFVGDAVNEIRRVMLHTLSVSGIHEAQVDVAIVNDCLIREVNETHLSHDWETDVITFPYACADGRVEGEVIVSWETAAREANITGWPEMTELLLYCIHGALHLVGFDDLDADSRRAMREREREILEHLGLEGWEKYDVDAVQRALVARSEDPSERFEEPEKRPQGDLDS